MANSAKPKKPIFKRYFRSTFPYWRYMIIALSMMLVVVAISILLPRLFKIIIDDYIPNKNFPGLLESCLILLFLYFIRMGAFIFRNNQMLHFGYYYIYDLRTRLMKHFQLLSFRYYNRVKTGDIMNRMLDDVMNVEMMTTNSLVYLIEDVLMIIVVTIMLVLMNAKLALMAVMIIPLYGLIHSKFRRRIGDKNDNIRVNYAQLSSVFHETVAGVKVIRAFNLEEHKRSHFDDYLKEDRYLRINTYTFNAIFHGLTEYLTIIGIMIVLVGGGWYAITDGSMTSGEIVAFYTYLGYLYNPIIRLSGTTAVIEAGISSIRRIYEVLDTMPSPPERAAPVIPAESIKGSLQFDKVTFFYDSDLDPAIRDMSFEIPAGRSIALVGHSGAGKSTILNLVSRFYDPSEGVIRMDGHDLKDLPLQYLRSHISLVLQEGFLFWGSIRENIRLGRIEASDAEVEEAARLAHAHDFIVDLPNAYETAVGERGFKLSGGQRQRIAIARAILKDAPILILDEATSALDNESEYHIQQAMKEIIANRTTLVIAHRLSTIRFVDEIFVMEGGKLIERGSHDALLQRDSRYAQLHNIYKLVP